MVGKLYYLMHMYPFLVSKTSTRGCPEREYVCSMPLKPIPGKCAEDKHTIARQVAPTIPNILRMMLWLSYGLTMALHGLSVRLIHSCLLVFRYS